MSKGTKTKAPAKQAKHKSAILKYSFSENGDQKIPLVDATAQMILQFASMAKSESPELRVAGRAKIQEIAEFCVAGQFFLANQTQRAAEQRATIETDCGGTSLAALAREFAGSKDSMGDPVKPRELWPHLVARLDELGLEPKEDKFGVDFEGGRIKKDVFRVSISRERTKGKTKIET